MDYQCTTIEIGIQWIKKQNKIKANYEIIKRAKFNHKRDLVYGKLRKIVQVILPTKTTLLILPTKTILVDLFKALSWWCVSIRNDMGVDKFSDSLIAVVLIYFWLCLPQETSCLLFLPLHLYSAIFPRSSTSVYRIPDILFNLPNSGNELSDNIYSIVQQKQGNVPNQNPNVWITYYQMLTQQMTLKKIYFLGENPPTCHPNENKIKWKKFPYFYDSIVMKNKKQM